MKLKYFQTIVISAVLVSVLLSQVGCTKEKQSENANQELKGELAISGAFAIYPLVVKWAEEFQKLNPNVIIDVTAGGTGKGVTDVLSETADIGMAGRDLNESEIKQGAFGVAIGKDAVLATGNSQNPVIQEIFKKGISAEIFNKIYVTKEITTWGQVVGNQNDSPIEVYKRSDAGGVTESWAKFLKADQDDLKGIGIFGDPAVAEAVKRSVNGVGFNNTLYVYDSQTRLPYPGLTPIPYDVNGNGILESSENVYQNLDSLMNAIKFDRFPTPPSRMLYLFTKNKPTNPLAIAFLKWCLTDGQKYCNEAGYVNLEKSFLEKENSKF